MTLVADPGRKFLYASDFNSGMVFAYSIDAATGNLTALSNSPYSTPFVGNGGPLGMAKFLRGACVNMRSISG